MGEWDDTLKRLFMTEPQDIISWLIPGALFIELVPLEVSVSTKRQALMEVLIRYIDILYKIRIYGKEVLLHIEIQKTKDPDMAERVWEYNVLASLRHKVPVYSVIIYLTAKGKVPRSPLKRGLDVFQQIHIFRFRNIKVAEAHSEEFTNAGLLGVLPMSILTKDGRTHEKVAMVLNKLKNHKDLLILALMLAAMVYTSNEDLDWLRKEVRMMDDILTDNWFVQYILEKGREQERQEAQQHFQQEVLQRFHQAVLNTIQARFPEITLQAQKQIDQVTDLDQLQQLIVNVSIARDAAEVAQLLAALSKAD